MGHYHFIGIGGTGLSAIARVLHERGSLVSGSDRHLSQLAAGLQDSGVKVTIGHRSENVNGATVVIRSSAVPDDNVEVQTALQKGIPVIKRADFLNILMEGKVGIAVAGSHGKTTTSGMLAWLLTDLNLEPTFIVGGVVNNLGTNAAAGEGDFFVIEADEYDYMFLGLKPDIAVVTNIEHDHPDCFPTPEIFFDAFRQFSDRLASDGKLFIFGEGQETSELMAYTKRKNHETYSFGFDPNRNDTKKPKFDYYACNLNNHPGKGYSFDVYFQEEMLDRVSLSIPGQHNVLNTLAAFAVGYSLGLEPTEMSKSLSRFQGTGRRFEVRGQVGGITVVDDYAHHPTEIRVTLDAARDYFPNRKIWVVWQPHTFSRVITLSSNFVNVFKPADKVIVTDIYAARESRPEGFDIKDITDRIDHSDVMYISKLDSVRDYLLERLEPGDVLLTLSAGDADWLSEQILGLKTVTTSTGASSSNPFEHFNKE